MKEEGAIAEQLKFELPVSVGRPTQEPTGEPTGILAGEPEPQRVEAMPGKGYFDIKRDIELEKAGGFWCDACLVTKPATEQSPDCRYCQGCFGLLLKEAVLLRPQQRRPEWLPRRPVTPPKARQMPQSDAGVAIYGGVRAYG